MLCGVVGQRRFYRGCRIGQQLCSVGGIKAPCRVQQRQRRLLLQILHLTPRCVRPRQFGEVALVLCDEAFRGVFVSGLNPQSKLFIAGAVPGNGVHIFRHRNAPFLISAAFLPPRKCAPIPCPAHIRQRHSRCPSAPCPGSSPPDTVPPAAGHRRSSLSGDACGWCRCGY